MMTVKVKVVGDLRRFAQADSVEIEGRPCTVGSAVDELVRRNPGLREQLFDREGRMHYATVLAVNGRAADWAQNRESEIEDGGELVVTRFHSGG